MNIVFYRIIGIVFVLSLMTSIMYFRKLVKVFKYQHSEPSVYMYHAYPAVQRAKIWNLVQSCAHVLAFCVYLTNPARVCSGWYVYETLNDELEVYLLLRGAFLVASFSFGLANIAAYFLVTRKAIN
jgi:hypothetical protein